MKTTTYLPIALCVLLLSVRMFYAESITYVFLAWNLILGYVPYKLSVYVYSKKDQLSSKAFYTSFFLWLLFLPNALYVISDIKHFKVRPPAPEWLDSLLLFVFAFASLYYGVQSVQYMFRSLLNRGKNKTWLLSQFLLPVSLLSGFGVYLGRVERWNSWDLFVHPIQLLKNALHLLQYPEVWCFSLSYGIMFMVACWMFLPTKQLSFTSYEK